MSVYANLKVLIVDDFNSFRLTLSKIIHELGFRHVDSVGTGEEAIALCKKEHYDLILCDYNLGQGKNGQQLLEDLRLSNTLKPQDIFILLSAETSRHVVMSAYDCEPDAYLTKPITSKVIEQRLKRLMVRRMDLLEISLAMSKDKKAEAVELLKKKVSGQSRHTMDCQKLLADLYIEQNKLDEAERIYQAVLEVRALTWAQVGLANIKLKKGDPKKAIEWLNKIIEENPSFMKAYDVLSEALKSIDDNDCLQKNLERAVEVSPMSVGRQISLGDVAMSNGDSEVAANAFRKTIRYGVNSCHDTPDNQLNFIKSVTEFYSKDAFKAEEMAKEAIKIVSALEDNPEADLDNKIKNQLLGSQLLGLKGEEEKSYEMLENANKMIGYNDDIDLDLEIELINALIINKKEEESKEKIKKLLAIHSDNQSALEKIDVLLDDPVSDKAKEILTKSNKKGIESYQNKEYDQAVIFFDEVEKRYPRYIGVKLNILQTLIGKINLYGKNREDEARCWSIVKSVQSGLRPGDTQYDRYRQLQEMLRTAGKQ